MSKSNWVDFCFQWDEERNRSTTMWTMTKRLTRVCGCGCNGPANMKMNLREVALLAQGSCWHNTFRHCWIIDFRVPYETKRQPYFCLDCPTSVSAISAISHRGGSCGSVRAIKSSPQLHKVEWANRIFPVPQDNKPYMIATCKSRCEGGKDVCFEMCKKGTSRKWKCWQIINNKNTLLYIT